MANTGESSNEIDTDTAAAAQLNQRKLKERSSFINKHRNHIISKCQSLSLTSTTNGDIDATTSTNKSNCIDSDTADSNTEDEMEL